MEYDVLAGPESIEKTVEALTKKGMTAEVVETRADALEKIKALIPDGASIMNGSSRTLDEIGYTDYVKKGSHNWKNLHEAILEERDAEKQAHLRKQSVLSDFYLGSVHAVSEHGEVVIASNSGSQLPHIVYTSPNIIFIVGAQKITPDLASALTRVNEYVLPLEDERMKEVGMGGSFVSKLLILYREPAFMGRFVHVIIVKEKLGF